MKKILSLLLLAVSLAPAQFLGPPTAYSRVTADSLSDTALTLFQIPPYGGSNVVKMRSMTTSQLRSSMIGQGGRATFDTISCTLCYFNDTSLSFQDSLMAGFNADFGGVQATSLIVSGTASANVFTADSLAGNHGTFARTLADTVRSSRYGGVRYYVGTKTSRFPSSNTDSLPFIFRQGTSGAYRVGVAGLFYQQAVSGGYNFIGDSTIVNNGLLALRIRASGLLTADSGKFTDDVDVDSTLTARNVNVTTSLTSSSDAVMNGNTFSTATDTLAMQCFGPDQCAIRANNTADSAVYSDRAWTFPSVTTSKTTIGGSTYKFAVIHTDSTFDVPDTISSVLVDVPYDSSASVNLPDPSAVPGRTLTILDANSGGTAIFNNGSYIPKDFFFGDVNSLPYCPNSGNVCWNGITIFSDGAYWRVQGTASYYVP